MSGTIEFLVRYGYLLLFAWVFVEQLGLPLPSAPLLMAAGALAGTHRMNLAMALAVPIAAAVICDALWYGLGRARGVEVLRRLCRISLEPDSRVRRTKLRFGRYGPWALVVGKFVPGLNAMAPPLAGISRMPWQRYAFFDGLGTLLWTGGYIGTGYVFSGKLEHVAAQPAFLGREQFVLLLAGVLFYITWKYSSRYRYLNKLRVARISPEELHQRMNAGEKVMVVDLREALEFESEPRTIPGAVHMNPLTVEEALELIPRDREIVLFCGCPGEATAVRIAVQLRNQGITRVRHLSGGLADWRDRGFPMGAPEGLGQWRATSLAPPILGYPASIRASL